MFRFLRGLFVLAVLVFYVLVLPTIGVYYLLNVVTGKGC